jgi:ubiquinone/menaquinone biosynthesis C-methylase UbiE
MAKQGHVLASLATAEELRNPLASIDTSCWLGNSIRGWHVLCLAAGGGRHSVLYRAAGAIVTVVDISQGMLDLDRQAIRELNYDVRLIQASMSAMPMLRDQEFDLVIHPVSTCYVAEIEPVFREVSRVLKMDGLYISQHKQPINVQASLYMREGHYCIETELGKPGNPTDPRSPSPVREPYTIEYAHSLHSLVGGICRSGMVIEDFVEPNHAQTDAAMNTLGHRSRFAPPYLRIKARKKAPFHAKSPSLFVP